MHVLTPPGLQIPARVFAYLAKGCKFIPDRRSSYAAKVLREVDTLERSLHIAVFFDSKGRHAPSNNGRFKMNSAWKPPICDEVALYCRLLRHDLAKYQALQRVRNEDHVDRAARLWLMERRDQICVVDADKNLGDAIVPRMWVHQEALRLLKEASNPISHDAYTAQAVELKFTLDGCFHRALQEGCISNKELRFLVKDFSSQRAGAFRLRIKLRKNPVVGRPVMNLSKAFIGPAAVYLVEVLRPLMKELPYVIASSAELLEQLEGQLIPDGYVMCTFDIWNLYPSISREHFLSTTLQRISSFWRHDLRFAKFLMQLCELVLSFQYVQFDDQIWRVEEGLPTGLQTSVVFANIYLAGLDEFIQTQQPCVRMWRRFINDTFAILPKLQVECCFSRPCMSGMTASSGKFQVKERGWRS